MAKESDLLLTKLKKMNNNKNQNPIEDQVTLNGMMVFGTTSNGLNIADFECCEDVALRPYTAKCKVQRMRDGNLYITELKKRVPNKPIFREDNSSLSLGKDGKYYFFFSLPAVLVEELPDKLTQQALAIAQKVVNEILYAEAEEVK